MKKRATALVAALALSVVGISATPADAARPAPARDTDWPCPGC